VLQADLANLREEMARTTGITDRQAEQVTRLAERWDKLKETARSAFLTIGQSSGLFDAVEKGLKAVQGFARPQAFSERRGVAQGFIDRQLVALGRLLQAGPLGLLPQAGGGAANVQPTGVREVQGSFFPGRTILGGDLARSNQLLEQIRNNTARLGAVAQ